MLLEELEKKQVAFKKINLGYRTGGSEFVKNPFVDLKYNPFESIGIISRAGYGKSVLLKRIYSPIFKHTGRTGIIFDLQSEDHHLSKYPNSDYRGFKKGEERYGLNNINCYSPYFARREKHSFDSVFGIGVKDTIKRDWIKLDKDGVYGLTGKGSALLAGVLRDNNPDSFEDIIGLVPELKENKNTIQAALNVLEDVRDEDVFVDNTTKYYDEVGNEKSVMRISDFTERMKKEICVINFHQNEEFMGLYIGVILRNLYWSVRENIRLSKIIKPIVIIEEADLALNKENGSLIGCNKWVMEILRRARKYGFYLILSTQQASDLYPQVKNHIKTWIVGDLVPQDQDFFSGYFSEEVMHAIKNLNNEKNDYGASEWCIVHNRKHYETFYPFNSPSQIHRIKT